MLLQSTEKFHLYSLSDLDSTLYSKTFMFLHCIVTCQTYFYFFPGATFSENHGHSGLAGILKFVIHTNGQQILGIFWSTKPPNFSKLTEARDQYLPRDYYVPGIILHVILSNAHESPRGEWAVLAILQMSILFTAVNGTAELAPPVFLTVVYVLSPSLYIESWEAEG